MKQNLISKPKKFNRALIFVLPTVATCIIWAIYMFSINGWKLFYHYFYMSITMTFGSFVAGGSSEGRGAISFPVMTLFF